MFSKQKNQTNHAAFFSKSIFSNSEHIMSTSYKEMCEKTNKINSNELDLYRMWSPDVAQIIIRGIIGQR